LKSIIKDAAFELLEQQGFYTDCQNGFVKGRSTLTNLLETLESNWTRILEDLKKALELMLSTWNTEKHLTQ